MELNPMEYVEEPKKPKGDASANLEENAAQELLAEEKKESKLNSWVAISVALLATFVALCTVTDRNIVKQMDYAQAQSLDDWSFYQARNIRGLVAQTASDTFAIEALSATGPSKPAFVAKAADYKKQADYQADQKKQNMDDAKKFDAQYEKLKKRDEQFDVSEAILAIAVSMLALTALTHKKWLFWASMAPMVLGIVPAAAGLMHIMLPIDFISRLLS